jgi:hypothetical protein
VLWLCLFTYSAMHVVCLMKWLSLLQYFWLQKVELDPYFLSMNSITCENVLLNKIITLRFVKVCM